jgi:hypothetical protein
MNDSVGWQLPFTIQLSAKANDGVFKRTLFSILSTTLVAANKIKQKAMRI